MYMIKNNTRAVFILLGCICLVGLFFGIRSYTQWKGNYYFGQVVSVAQESFTLSGRRSREYVVDVTDRTVIKKGFGTEVSMVAVGDRVIVIGKVTESFRIDASLVRIMGRKNNNGQ